MNILSEVKLLKFSLRDPGFTIMELVVGMAIAAIAIFASTFLLTSIIQENTRLNLEESLLSQKALLLSYLERDDVWTTTVNHADNVATFGCLLASTPCPPTIPGFKIFSPTFTVLFDGQTASAGFTEKFVPCTTYPSAACPLHAKLDWLGICVTCPEPKIEVRLSLEVAPSANQVAKTVQSRFQELRYLKTLP